jgi:hypothetical protein
MLRRISIYIGLLTIVGLTGELFGQSDDLATFPQTPEAGAPFQVAHLRDVAELQLGQKPTGVIYQWTVTVRTMMAKSTKSCGSRAARASPNGPSIQVEKARTESTYSVTLKKTTGDVEKDFLPLGLSFGRDGTGAIVRGEADAATPMDVQTPPGTGPPAASNTVPASPGPTATVQPGPVRPQEPLTQSRSANLAPPATVSAPSSIGTIDPFSNAGLKARKTQPHSSRVISKRLTPCPATYF